MVKFIYNNYLFPIFFVNSFFLLANAISDGLPADLGFGITGVNTSTLVHSIIFTAGTVLNNIIVKRFGAHRTIPVMMTAWAVCTWAHTFLHVCIYRLILF